MIRELRGEIHAYVLDTAHTTYALRVLPTGQLEQLYYGESIPLDRPEDLEPLTEKRAFAPGNTVVYDAAHPELSLEDVCLECSAPGKGDLREPMAELVHADGGRTSDFRFRSGEILPSPPEWGALLNAGKTYISTYPHMVLFPGIMIMLTILGFNLFGNGLRDALDPRLN